MEPTKLVEDSIIDSQCQGAMITQDKVWALICANRFTLLLATSLIASSAFFQGGIT